MPCAAAAPCRDAMRLALATPALVWQQKAARLVTVASGQQVEGA
jgi:hypothetical protein